MRDKTGQAGIYRYVLEGVLDSMFMDLAASTRIHCEENRCALFH